MRRHNPNVNAVTSLTLSEVPRTSRNTLRVIGRCGHALPAGSRRDARYCSPACRQLAYRTRRDGVPAPSTPELERVENPESDPRARRARRLAPPVAVHPSGAHAVDVPHEHSPRLCAVCMEARARELRKATRARVSAELVARAIRADGGEVDGAAYAFGISANHANAIRAGFRGDGRRAAPIPYSSRGWTNGRRNGWSTLELETPGGLVVLDGGRSSTRRATGS